MRAGLVIVIAALPLFHNLIGRPVIVLGSGEAAIAKRRLVERAGGIAVGEDVDARLAFVALDVAPEAAVARLRARAILVNCVDRPDLCDFITPAILDRAPVLLAIGTGGASAGLAKAIRLRLEQILPQRLGALADALARARPAMRQRWADAGDRRRALDLATGAGGLLDPLVEGAETAVDAWLAGADTPTADGVEIMLTSPDPEDLTLRQARLLGSADVIAYEANVPEAVLARARADAVRVRLDEARPEAQGLVIVVRQHKP